MKIFEIKSFPSDKKLADAVAQDWITLLQTAPRPHLVALSGGGIAEPFFKSIAKLAKKNRDLLDGVHFFWADERCVKPTDLESNFLAAEQSLFKPLKIPPEQIHRVRGELLPSKAVAQAIAELRQTATKKTGTIPVLDLIFLGLGQNGHTASLMPNATAAVSKSRQPYVHVANSPKPPPNRITLSYPVMAAAKEVWMLAAGKGKEDALQESIKPKGRTPFARVLESRPFTRIYSSISI